MTFPLLPYLADPSDTVALAKYAVVGQVLVPFTSAKKHFIHQFPNEVLVYIDTSGTDVLVDQLVELLNVGVSRVVITEKLFAGVVDAGLPTFRFIVQVEGTIPKSIIDSDSSIIVNSPLDKKLQDDVSDGGNKTIYVKTTDQNVAIKLAQDGLVPLINTTDLSTSEEAGKVSIGKVFTSTLTTDRPDGLFTTLITSTAPANTALGVVYSLKASIEAAIKEQVGVYQSRKRTEELWYKGKTSGATQKLVTLLQDCDNDVVKFVVEPREGFGFCHLSKNYTCFHDHELYGEFTGSGLSKLDTTLAERLVSAPEGSYTKRLFSDDKLLIAKLKEELDELIEAGQANDKDEVAWEAADLIYFVMTWAVKNGVRLADIEKNLDIKSLKVTRRKGDAKDKYLNTEKVEPVKVETPKEDPADYSITTIEVKHADKQLLQKALTRPVQKTADIMKLVFPIIEQVKKDGDKALLELTQKFDGVKLDSPILKAPFPPELMQISQDMKDAIDLSISNIEKFHSAQLPKEKIMTVETSSGVFCSRFAKPIENVGLYVPGGTAVLPSTAMMLGVPAKVAGCKNIILASPPARATGKLTPEVVYVAHKIGAKCIVMAGGAQAVTAMAYGTESVLKCDKILGPGNQFVTAAKMYVQNDTTALCSIDMPAGPSEVLVIADSNADADFVALDLLSQAEHGVDSQVIMIGVGLSKAKLEEFNEAISRQASVLPRKEIVAKCLAHSFTLLVDTIEEAFDLSNEYAPEHLILQIDDAPKYVPDYIENAGSVFVGGLSPESCGDYSSGTNHTLPTYGYARQYSGVNTATFQKFITSQEVTKEGLKSIGKAVMTLAAVEGLEAHRNAIQVRMDKLGL